MKINSDYVMPTRQIDTGVFEKNPVRNLKDQSEDVAPKKVAETEEQIFPSYGADGRIEQTQKVGSKINQNL